MAAAPKPSQPSPEGEPTAYQLATEKLPAAVREKLYRIFTLAKIPENDPIWAIVGVQTGILEPFVASQPHVEALNKALSTIERAADRINKRSQYLNLGWPLAAIVLSAALSLVGAAIWHDWIEKAEQARRDQMAQAYEQSDEGMWWHNLRATRAGLRSTLGDKDSNGVSRRLTLMVGPGKEPGSWKLTSANLDAGGNAVLTFHNPEPGAAEADAAAAHHR
jgi:hypothetical protein